MERARVHLIEKHREAVTARWRRLIAGSRPDWSGDFITGRINEFANPARAIIGRAAAAMFDGLLMADGAYAEAIDDLMRLRAVQDLPDDEALRFLSLLEDECLDTLRAQGCEDLSPEERAHIAAKLNEMTREARGRYARCREKINDLRSRECERMRPRSRVAASGDGVR